MSGDGLKKKDLEEITDTSIIERYLKIVCDLHERVSCYFKGADSFFETQIMSVERKANRIRLDLRKANMNPEQLRDSLISTLDRTANLSFRAQDTMFFAKCKVASVQPEHLNLELPPSIYKLQRRANLRIRIHDAGQAQCEFSGLGVLVPYDVSAGGFSLLLSTDEAERFPPGMPDLEVKFTFEGVSAKLQLDVKSQAEAPDAKGRPRIKVGFAFRKLPPPLEQQLARAAVVHTQKVFSKKI